MRLEKPDSGLAFFVDELDSESFPFAGLREDKTTLATCFFPLRLPLDLRWHMPLMCVTLQPSFRTTTDFPLFIGAAFRHHPDSELRLRNRPR